MIESWKLFLLHLRGLWVVNKYLVFHIQCFITVNWFPHLQILPIQCIWLLIFWIANKIWNAKIVKENLHWAVVEDIGHMHKKQSCFLIILLICRSGYSLFSTEQLLKKCDTPSQQRMAMISEMWWAKTEADRESYKKKRDVMAKLYEKNLAKYKKVCNNYNNTRCCSVYKY